jgi:hypothetical protein
MALLYLGGRDDMCSPGASFEQYSHRSMVVRVSYFVRLFGPEDPPCVFVI